MLDVNTFFSKFTLPFVVVNEKYWYSLVYMKGGNAFFFPVDYKYKFVFSENAQNAFWGLF